MLAKCAGPSGTGNGNGRSIPTRRKLSLIEASGIEGVEVDGIDPMWLIRFDDPKRQTRFLELAVRHGVLFKRGAYNYAAIAHDDDVIRAVEAAASAAFVDLRDEEREA